MIIACVDYIIVTAKIRVTSFSAPHSEVEPQTESFTAAHLGSNKNQSKGWIVGGTFIKSNRSVYAPHLVQSVRLCLFRYRGDDNAHWISKNRMAAVAVQWELCGSNFPENNANLQASCYNGNYDRSARVLFIHDGPIHLDYSRIVSLAQIQMHNFPSKGEIKKQHKQPIIWNMVWMYLLGKWPDFTEI